MGGSAVHPAANLIRRQNEIVFAIDDGHGGRPVPQEFTRARQRFRDRRISRLGRSHALLAFGGEEIAFRHCSVPMSAFIADGCRECARLRAGMEFADLSAGRRSQVVGLDDGLFPRRASRQFPRAAPSVDDAGGVGVARPGPHPRQSLLRGAKILGDNRGFFHRLRDSHRRQVEELKTEHIFHAWHRVIMHQPVRRGALRGTYVLRRVQNIHRIDRVEQRCEHQNYASGGHYSL